MSWRRFDTLGLRLFVLMWVTLVLSHLVAYTLALPLAAPRGGPSATERLNPGQLPTLPSLPPGSPFDRGAPPGAPSTGGGPPPALPAAVLWLDYALRGLVIALGAALGARWLSAPMRRLSRASRELSQGLARGQPPPVLDERRGTVEVREVAQVFNGMAQQLQEQFDARGMHLASVSHDLRTPLTRLRMRLEDAEPTLADAANADIHEMSEMIDATLDVLHEQRAGSQAQRVDLRALLEAATDDLRATGHEVGLIDGPPLFAQARPAALKRVLANLLGNALRYGGSAQLALQLADDGVLITVDDRGPGIPPEQLELAFRPWVRLHGAHPHARSGHGLGLAIARDLAERDGGRLTLENRAEGGLRARLWFPNVSAPTRDA
jgi:protein-histidine pros-kinase